MNKRNIALAALILAASVAANAAGGLEVATTKVSEIKTWGYSFLGVVAAGYVIFNIIMAYIGKKSWGDVAMSLVYCVIAGGAITGGEYAWKVWGN